MDIQKTHLLKSKISFKINENSEATFTLELKIVKMFACSSAQKWKEKTSFDVDFANLAKLALNDFRQTPLLPLGSVRSRKRWSSMGMISKAASWRCAPPSWLLCALCAECFFQLNRLGINSMTKQKISIYQGEIKKDAEKIKDRQVRDSLWHPCLFEVVPKRQNFPARVVLQSCSVQGNQT